MIFNKILVCSFGLALFNTNINAMENNNKTNVNVMENNNKLSISKQENFKINSHNITTQSRLNKLEKKIDEILELYDSIPEEERGDGQSDEYRPFPRERESHDRRGTRIYRSRAGNRRPGGLSAV